MPLMVSISGIRGVIGESLTPEVAVRYAAAFGKYCMQRTPAHAVVVVGRDGRVTGGILANIISSTLLSTGVNVRALGICPTPTVQVAVEQERAAGGISVTASHNPIEWNGMKFVAPTGMFLDAAENRELWRMADQPPLYARWDSIGKHSRDDSWLQRHVDMVLRLPYIDREAIARRKFRVVVDCINAAGGLIVPGLLRSLGCTVIEMNCDAGGIFARPPEPVPENLTDLARRVAGEKADLGIAVDPDVDRLVLITERGEPYGEEYTVASAIRFVLDRERGRKRRDPLRVVVNLSTTRAVDDIAGEFGAEVLRTPVGEINVAKRMKEEGAIIGGEGSGGIILPAVHFGRDAIVGIGLILQLLADFRGPLSALKASLPGYSIAKGKMELRQNSPDEVLEKTRLAHIKDGGINTEDGLKIDFQDYWVHLRKSNTEPIIRIIAEARTAPQASATVEKFRKEIVAYLS